MKNVLLLCLSVVKEDEKYNQYVYEINEEEEALDGYMTNEAPTKAVIKKLHSQNQRLDKVVMLCTNRVLNEAVKLNSKELITGMGLKKYKSQELENLEITKENNKELFILQKYKHIDFYKEKVNTYAETLDGCYITEPIEYVVVNMPDVVEDYELTESSLEAAKQVMISENKIQLYIDFNGGPRTVPFMILAVSNLMKLRDVEIQEIMSMNYDNSKKKTRIQNMMPVFESFDLVTGINEYIRYGYIDGLKEYFKSSKNEDIKNILKKMEEFANNLQLCRTEYIMREKGNLWDLLEEYVEKYEEKQAPDTYEQLFLYVLRDIMDGCKNILKEELPDVINWCVERGFVQQALTFCSEEMPAYFWQKKIYYASRIEELAYKYLVKKWYKLDKSRGVYKAGKERESRRIYNWMISYVPHVEDCKSVLRNFKDTAYKELIDETPNDERDEVKEKIKVELEEIQNKFIKISGLRLTDSEMHKNSLPKARYHASVLLYWHEKRSESKLPYQKLGEILTVYFLLKEQRNISNHASDDPKAWSYGYLCNVMKQMAKVLGEIS